MQLASDSESQLTLVVWSCSNTAIPHLTINCCLEVMDTHAFGSLAHVRILLMPVGSIPQSTFEKYASDIRSFDSIRLGDIPVDHKDDKGDDLIVFLVSATH